MSVEGLFLMNFLKTVSTGPSSRSFPHVNDKSLDEITIMNSAEEISKYSDNNSHYRSPTLARRAGTELDETLPNKPAKKDKKWSLGGLFRRRKKDIESGTSSEEENPPKRGFLLRRKQRKEDKRKKRANKSLGHFDHIVVTPVHQGNNYIVNGVRDHDDSGGILSDPTVGYPVYSSINSSKRASSIDKVSSKESLNRRHDLNLSRASIGSGSLDSIGKKSRREKVKARVEAIRDRMKNDSSSDEESQRSTTSSVTKFKSDDSLSRKDGTSSRKSRTARTERYNRRLTKEEELVLNREAELGKQRSLKSDSENQTRVQVNRWIVVDEMAKSPPLKPYVKPVLNYSPSVPLPQKSYSGISTIPPSHSIIHRTTSNLSDNQRNYYNASHKPANMYPNMMRNNKNYYPDRHDIFKPEQRSFSYDCNINRSPTPNNEVIHVQFPLGKPVPKQRNPNLINNYQNLSNQSLNKTTPPPPPPRDPQRRIIPNQYENSRPMSYAFENGNQHQQRSVPIHHPVNRTFSIQSYNTPNPNQQNINRAHSFGWQTNYNYRSNSEDHIAQANQYNNHHLMNRPASATPDVPQQRFIRRHPTSDQYKYFAEKTPRSRKPIHIAATQPEQTYLSDSQVVTRSPSTRHPVQAASEFWRQKDAEEIRRKSQLMEKTKLKTETKKPEEKEPKKNFSILNIPIKATTDSLSSLSNSDSSPLTSKQFFEQNNEAMMRPLSIVSERSEAQDTVDCARPSKDISPMNYSRQNSASSNDTDELEKKKRRSSNLEDALDELEAIYKSLRLGDEDLLDRAERRDVSVALTQKLLTKAPETYNRWGVPAGAQSDSSFNYDCLDALRKKKSRRSCIPDKVNDDMAYRRLNKERPPPLDPSVAVSQVSYLLASPLLGTGSVDENDNEHTINPTNEPDITLDDVVYRNLKHMNNTLKIADPQPPFGIPIGPITAAANSDYLHAVPENRIRSRFIPQKSPDIVKDDLAYRNLRKDSGFAADDYINNNNTPKSEALKKRKAVRSITTNIYNAMHRDSMRATESENEFEKTQSLTDIADAMEIARQILKDRQNKIYRKSTVSDTEATSKLLTPNMNNRSNNQTSTETLTESKTNLLNELNKEMLQQKIYTDEPINQKPPICPTPDRKSSKPATKESTPIRISPAPEETPLDRNHLEDLLTALAKEAQETSEKLGNDLKLLEEESKKCSPRISESSSPLFERAKSPLILKNAEDKITSPKVSQTCTPAEERAKSPMVIKSLDEKLSDIDAVSEHAKLCEKLLGAVVESTKLISHSIPAPHETVLEEVDDMTEPKIFKSVANVVVTRKAELPTSPVPKPEELISEPEHDYENIQDEAPRTCTSPFEENKTKLLADFQELKKDLFSDNTDILDDSSCSLHSDDASAAAPHEDDDSEKLQDDYDDVDDSSSYSEEELSITSTTSSGGSSTESLTVTSTLNTSCHQVIITSTTSSSNSHPYSNSHPHPLRRPVSCGNVPLSLMLNGDGNAGVNQMRDENMGKMVQNGGGGGAGGDGNTAIRDDERNGVVVARDYEKETRMKRYKEERRKQLEQVAARVNVTPTNTTTTTTTTTTGRENRRLQGQTPNSPRRFITRPKSTTPNPSTVSDCVRGDGSSGSDGLTVRTTRASRLRAARVNAADNNTANKKLAIPTTIVSTAADGKERSPLSLSTDASCASLRISRQEKDKSSKRKSNLNRSLNTEEVPSPDSHDESINTRRRRRRVLNPSDILVSLNESGLSSGSTSTSARVTPLPSPSATSHQQQQQSRTPHSTTITTTTTPSSAAASPRRSELRIHMENARRGVISSDCATKPRQSPIHSSLEASTKLVARQMMIASWDGTPKAKSPLMTASLDGSLKSRQPPVKRVYTSSPRQRNDLIERKKSSSEQEEYYSLSDREFRMKKTDRKASSSDEKALRHNRKVVGAEFDNNKSGCKVSSSSDCGGGGVRKVFGDKKVNVPSASKTTNDISKRMDELTAFTRETLARVERLTNRSQLSPRRETLDSRKKSPEKVLNRNNRIDNNNKTKVTTTTTLNNSVQALVEQQPSLNVENVEENDDPSSTKPSSILKLKKKQSSSSSQDETLCVPVVTTAPQPVTSVHIHGPVSILKRKSSQDEAGSSSNTSSFTTPVTFSPTVVDPIPNRKKPGILKKRCSLDESHVIRRRSYSPDVALVEGSSDYRPILKNQRRSSLEEIVRTRSPDTQQPQGILKRKHSRGEEEFGERSLGSPEPQSILKRKSGTSSSGSSGNSPHVSIATAVILAAAGGAEIILEPSEPVKPILKKKSFSDENPNMESLNPEVPKPILKKKSSTETDDQDDKPMKPILKTSRKCSSQEDNNYSSNEQHGMDSPRYYSMLRNRSNHNSGESGSECETATVRPILKQSSSRENSPRPRLSFCNDNDESLLNRSSSPRSPDAAAMRRSKFVRRSNTVADAADLSSIINLKRSFENKELAGSGGEVANKEEPHIPKRPISVFEIVMNFEKTTNSSTTSTGAIPKRSSMKGSRNSGRFRTQPITLDEFEATQILETVQNFQSTTSAVTYESHSRTSPVRIQDSTSPCSSSFSQKDHQSSSSIGDLSHSLDLSSSNNDSQLTTPSSIPNESSADSGVASKMSFVNESEEQQQQSDSCREDDLSPQELCRSNSVSAKASMFKQLEAQMKAVAEEAKALRLSRGGNKGMQRYRNRKQATTCPNAENRFSTQPVTLDEVQEAAVKAKANQRVNESPDEKDVIAATVDREAPTATNDTTTATDEADPSKLSLAERVKLFNQKITQERIPVAPGGGPNVGGASIVRKPRQARFKTQPITSEEVETAQMISPLAASLVKPPDANVLEGLSIRATKDKMYEHAAKMLTNEVRGILKSKSAISPIPSTTETATSSSNGHHHNDCSDDEGVVSITILSSPSADESTSSASETLSRTTDSSSNNKNKKKRETNNNEKENKNHRIGGGVGSAADIETINNKKNRDMSEMKFKVDECMKELEIRNKVRRHLEEVQQMSSSDGTPQTSDGESSGGREVKRIISNDAVARRRQAAINRQKDKNTTTTTTTLVKSKSQSSIVRDLPRTPLFSRSGHLDCSSGDRVTSDGAASAAAALVRGGVRRSLTLPLRPQADSDGSNEMPGGGTIADRLAELKNSGNNEWRKRLPKLNTANDELIQLNSIVTKNIYNDTLSSETISEKSSSILAARKDKLETASQQWKKRVEVNDALNFSVAGRMNQESKDLLVVSPLIVAAQGDKKKKTPKAERFRGKESEAQTISTPVSPEKICKIKFTRSASAPGVGEEDNDSEDTTPVVKTEGRRVLVPRPDDETFTTFFESVTKSTSQSEHLEVTGDDLDSVQRQQISGLLVTKKTVKVQRKHAGTTRNPIKALAARSDIKEEYTEIITGVAEREKRRINVEKLAKHSSMAIEALAGLASKEDFTAISLKKGNGTTNSSLVPYKDLMLLHIKGRRHVQTRLVEPVATSINQGDNYVLVTPTQVYNYIGPYSNIIEQSRGAEIAQHIQQKKDLNCKCNTVVTIHEGKNKNCTKSQLDTFWQLLGSTPEEQVTEAGYPDEDEIYESAIILTNMVYELDNNELVPVEAFWGALPKIEMLDSSKVLVFDFGSEMYIWSGRNVPIEQRKEASRLAKQLWENGYNYTDCTICPVNSVALLGARDDTLLDKKGARPDWALICKITQHGETILFREKFLDWPDFSRVIKIKNNDSDKIVDGSITVNPCDAEQMRSLVPHTPDLVLEGSHLGRGSSFFDEETNRHFEVATLAIKAWHILEYEYEELPVESIGQFYNGDSYIIRWQYMMTVTGRELSGKPSKHSMLGRDRCAYFCWQGKHAPLNEKGAAALLTVELDLERGPQVRVTQGAEPSAFLSLFEGAMTVHVGRRDNQTNATKRLYMCRGELENEMHLIEVSCSVRQLRSRISFLLCSSNCIFVWHGAKSTKNNRELSLSLAKKIQTNKPSEFQFNLDETLTIVETEEGDECPQFRELLGCTNNNRHLYFSLLKSHQEFKHTPRMFHLSSVSGVFKSNEIHCPHQGGGGGDDGDLTPYPFIQNDLYSASQPALFLIDNSHELWLWQGWWPETDSDSDSDSDRPYSDQTGSGQHRWQAERRAAMKTALDYWQGVQDKGVPAYLVWAGLEPLEFTNLFPTWTDRDDIAELNIRDGRKPGELLRIENELARLTQSTYPLVQLLQRPLPEGVDPTHLEDYLSSEDFVTLLGMTKPEFQKLPTWKQTNIKKDKGLF